MPGKQNLVWKNVEGDIVESQVPKKYLQAVMKRPAALAPPNKEAANKEAKAAKKEADPEEEEESQEEEEEAGEEPQDGDAEDDEGMLEEGEEEEMLEDEEEEAEEQECEAEDKEEEEHVIGDGKVSESEKREVEDEKAEKQETKEEMKDQKAETQEKDEMKGEKAESEEQDEKELKKMKKPLVMKPLVMRKPTSSSSSASSWKLVGKKADPNPVIDGAYYVNAKSGKNIRAYILARYGSEKTQLVQISSHEALAYKAITKQIHEEALEKIASGVRLQELKAWAASTKQALTRWAM